MIARISPGATARLMSFNAITPPNANVIDSSLSGSEEAASEKLLSSFLPNSETSAVASAGARLGDSALVLVMLTV
jgi:hypothetical protein